MGTMIRSVGAVAVMALLLAVGLGACGGQPALAPASSNTPLPPTNTPIRLAAVANQAPLAAVDPPPSPQAILEAAFEALRGVDSWHLEIAMPLTVEFKGLTMEVPVAYVGDFYAPDSLEGTASMKLFGIAVKKDTVLLARTVEGSAPGIGDGMATVKPATVFSLLEFIGLDPATLNNLELVGEETVDGTQVYHLRGKVTAEEMEVAQRGVELKLQGELKFEMWIGVADGLPRRGTVKGKIGVTDAALAGVGGAQGTVDVAGTATFSQFGQPVTVESLEFPVVVGGGMRCAAAGEGYVPYDSEREAITFCHPSPWVVDDLVDGCGFFVTSPNGVGPGVPMPDCLVLIYPDETVTRFTSSKAGAAEVCARTGLCFFKFVGNAVLNRGLGALTSGFLKNDPLVAMVTGIKIDDAKAVALSCMMDELTYRGMAEAIMYSILPGKAVGP